MRTVKHGAFFTVFEDQLLRARAGEANLTVAELIRAASLGVRLPSRPVRPSPIAADQWVELARLASNLNQLQRAVNRGDRDAVPRAVVEEMRALLRDVRAALLGTAP